MAFIYADQNIRSNVIAPGGVNTEINRDMDEWSELGGQQCSMGLDMMKRLGEPEEVAQLALFLLRMTRALSMVQSSPLTPAGAPIRSCVRLTGLDECF